MSNVTTIILKNSGTSGNTPNANNLQFGEIALNYADGILYYKNPSNLVLSISGSGGGGGESNTANAAFDQANLALVVAQTSFDNSNTKYTQNSNLLFVTDTINFKTDNVGIIKTDSGKLNLFSNEWSQLQYNPDITKTAYDSENSSWVYVDSNGVVAEAIGPSNSGKYASVVITKDPPQVVIYSGTTNTFTFSSNTLIFPDNSSQSTAYYPLVFDTANNAFNTANAAFDKANVANGIAIDAYTKANGAVQNGFVTVIANGTSLVADSNNDTLEIRTSGNVSIIANANGDNLTFDLTTTGVVASIYGNSTIVPIITVDSRGRLVSASNTTIDTSTAIAAFAKANGAVQNSFATIIANGISLVADSNNDTLEIKTSGNVSIKSDAAGDNLIFDLTDTGVVSSVYGNSTIVPIITVDSKGRLTSVTNTAIDNTIAIAAFDRANSKLNASGGFINGDLTITGNLTISGNSTFINVQTYRVDDPLIYLAANNYVSDLVDIGFIANYVNTTGSNVHTGLFRDSGTKEYYLFQGYDKEPENNHIDPNANNFSISFLNANIRSSNIILSGISLNDRINSVFNKANGAVQNGFVTIIANGISLVADSNNDTLEIKTTNNIAITADANGDNLTFDLTNTGVTAGVYGNATIIPVITVDSKGRLTSVSNVNTNIDTSISIAAFNKANGAVQLGWTTLVANDTTITPGSNSDTLTLRTTGNVSIVGVSANDNIIFDLTTTGVTAAVYGNATLVPVITVDSRGRVTSVTNTTITGLSSDTLQSVTIRGNTTANIVVITNNTNSVSNSTGALRVTGGVGVTGNVYVGVGSVVGYSNNSSISVVYQYYNSVTNSLDTVFG